MKKGIIILFIITIFLLSIAYAQEETVTCYDSKDCPATPQYWCDGESACQKLTQCLNPGTSQSECTIVDECVNCLNIGYLGCKDGQCQTIRCYNDAGCGKTSIERYCNGLQACAFGGAKCNNPGIVDSYCEGQSEGCSYCQYGCQDGICKEATPSTTCPGGVCPEAPQSTLCVDTDGGINYYTKGSIMFGNRISGVDLCEDDGITLEESGCVPNPGPNEGTILTNIYRCPNGCHDGVCIRGEKQKEEVKCIFKNTETEQKCYRAEYNWMYCSSYQGSCIVTNLEGYDGEKITWKSTCGGYAYTILDGNDEYAEFDCSGVTSNFCQSKQCDDGSWTTCHVDGKGYCVCSTCSQIIVKPVCGNAVCEAGEWQNCEVKAVTCEAGKECMVSPARCYYGCEQDCKGIEGIEAKLNEKFKLQISQPVKIIDYKEMKIIFRDLLTPKCEEANTISPTLNEKLTGGIIAGDSSATENKEEIGIIKCPEVGPMAQLEVINPEEMGKKFLTLKANEAKIVYGVSVSFVEYEYASRTGVFLVSDKITTCPENCKCDNEGYILECREEEICEEGKILCQDGECKEECAVGNFTGECNYGCIYGNRCLPIGVRVKGLYCSVDGTVTSQLEADEICENNFECKSNVCVAGECISGRLLQKIIEWFKRLFGATEKEIIDCGTDSECMENAFKECKRAKSNQGQFVYEIVGFENEKCVIKIAVNDKSMTCKFENNTLGTKSLGNIDVDDMNQYCKGNLIEYLLEETEVQNPVAEETNEMSACEKIRNPNLKYKCKAMLKKDPSDCERVEEPATAYCYADVALVTGNSAICGKIEDSGHKGACEALVEKVYSKCSEWIYADYCYRDVAALIGDTSICDQINYEGGKILCKAVILKDVSLCENTDSEDCYQILALLTGDEKMCDELSKIQITGEKHIAIANLDEEVGKCIKMAKKEITGCLFKSGRGTDCDLIPAFVKNPSLCENLKSDYEGFAERDSCYYYAAINTADLLPPQVMLLHH